jgi:hypothetical protein
MTLARIWDANFSHRYIDVVDVTDGMLELELPDGESLMLSEGSARVLRREINRYLAGQAQLAKQASQDS